MSSSSNHFDDLLTLTEVAPGIFERDLDRTWWGWNGQFGGYVLALALEACRATAPSETHRERSLSLNFLRRVQDGRLRVEVVVERAGRTVSNLSFKLSVDDKTVATGIAMFADDRDGQAFLIAEPPDLTIPTEVPDRSPIPAPAMDHIHVWSTVEGGLLQGLEVEEAGGWMKLRQHGGADERFGFFAADGCVPLAYTRFDQPQVGGSLDFTAYFREPFPKSVVEDGEPVRVVLRGARAHRGYIDEDAEIWSASGELLMQSRQTRYTEFVDIDALEAMSPDARLQPPIKPTESAELSEQSETDPSSP